MSDEKISMDVLFSGQASLRILTHESGKMALFIELPPQEEEEEEGTAGVPAEPEDDPSPKSSSIILPHLIVPDEYAPAAVTAEEAVLTV